MEPKTILKTLKEASPFDLFLVSFLLLPFVADSWLGVIKKLGLDQLAHYCGLGIVVVAYIIGIILMLQGSSRARRREIAKDLIIQYLTSKNFEMMSFDRVRKNINKSYTNEFLESLIEHFPKELRTARLKGSKSGIARIIESDEDEEA
ncbi:hypothetical protein [Candidatus Thiosymbion oneisti]|uniref:hypothetical protein n=1 Tax=Candidatus Thiosymbion oneisti TaxID=589554 RepID=UPI000B7EFB37|nr:hypothetical protein [Candidatus Thiosymbion oneisti]